MPTLPDLKMLEVMRQQAHKDFEKAWSAKPYRQVSAADVLVLIDAYLELGKRLAAMTERAIRPENGRLPLWRRMVNWFHKP